MKVAMLLENPLFFGGGEIHAYELARRLIKRGHEVGMIHMYGQSPKIPEQIPVISAWKFRKFIFGGYTSIPALTYHSTGYDVLHVHGLYAQAHLISSIIAKKLTKSPIICTLHLLRTKWRIDLLERMLSKKYVKYVDRFIAVSEYIRKRFIISYLKDVTVIHNGVDIDRFNPKIEGKQLRKKLGIDEEFVIFFVGRLIAEKGIKYLIRAMHPLVNKGNFFLVIGGVGPLKQELIGLTCDLGLGNFVKILGRIPEKELPNYYAACDVFVLPSLYEGLPLTLLEAMSTGKPVIATKVGGIPEVVTPGENGLLVEPRNPQQIASAIIKLYENTELAKETGKKGRQIVQEKYSWEKVVTQVLRIYEEALTKSSLG